MLHRIKDNESQNELHTSALLGQFEKHAVAADVAFTAHRATAYWVSHTIVIVTERRSRLGKFIFGSHTKM